MNVRLLTILLTVAAALWAMAPAAAATSTGEEPATPLHRQAGDDEDTGGPEPEDPPPIEDFWSVEEPASGGTKPSAGGTEPNPPAAPPQEQPAASSDQTSTSPGGNAQAPGGETTAPGAPAPSGDGGALLACDPRAGLRRALRSLRRAARGRSLLAPRPRAFGVRVRPCVPGTFELSIVEQRTGTVLWRARRELRTTRRATLRMTMTRPGRRFVARAMRRGGSRTVRMRLRATLTP